jgi:hypothetical protein
LSLSDEILTRPGAIAPIRELLSELVSDLGARSAFLVDEAGTPFGAFGNVEFPLPHPLSALTGRAGGDPLLEALVGEGNEPYSPTLLVHRVHSRALLAIELDRPMTESARRAAVGRLKRAQIRLAKLLSGPLDSSSPST